MKPYRGVVKGNTIVLERKPDMADGTEVLVLVKSIEDEETEIVKRQKALLDKGFEMGKFLYKKSEELHGRIK